MEVKIPNFVEMTLNYCGLIGLAGASRLLAAIGKEKFVKGSLKLN